MQNNPFQIRDDSSMNELIEDRGMMKKTVDRIGEMSTAMIKLTGESYRRKPKGGVF